jgi:hypothetical protein
MWDPTDKMRFLAPKRRSEKPGTVWILNAEQKPEARQIITGITDGSFSELVKGDLNAGDLVITGDTSAGQRSNQNQTRLPFLQGGGGGGGGRRGGF